MGHSLERLEGRLLLSASQQLDLSKLAAGGCPLCGPGGCRHTATAEGATLVSCNFNVGNAAATAAESQATVALTPLDQTFQLASRPSATKTIYLDFTGHTTTGTFWNDGGRTIVTPEYNVDGQPGFSDQELLNIQNIWARVVEDFSPFDVNVTTAEPSIDDLRKVGSGDSRWGIRVVIGIDAGSVAPGAGGVAYLGSFNWDSDTPTFVFPERLGNSNKSIAEATSHEVGHTLGLSHDGRSSPSEGYYYGHGSGATGWAPIMGVGYSREVVQWSKGEYANANNTQDDLGIIVGTVTNQYVPNGNGFGYRPDDYGSSVATAFQPVFSGGTTVTVAGIVERSTDVDVFEFTTAGRFTATISPATISPNLDVLAEIWSAAGSVLYAGNPSATLSAAFDLTLAAGTYFLAVRGTGTGNPTTGYSEYASLGQYTAQMTVETPTLPVLSIAAAAAVHNEGNSGTTNLTFTVTRSGATSGASSASWAVTGSGVNPANAADFAGGALPGGSVSFAAGETSKTITVGVQGDTAFEADEGFTIALSSPMGASLGSPAQASGTITNDDVPAVTLAVSPATVTEDGVANLVYTFSRIGPTTAALTVNYTVGGTATLGTDYTGISATGTTKSVTFAVGSSTAVVTVDPTADAAIEPDETVALTLASGTGYTVGTTTAVTGTITNDDPNVTLTVSPATVTEDGVANLVYTFSRTGPTTAPLTVNYTVGGTATVGTDYTGISATGTTKSVTFAVGSSTAVVTVDPTADAITEGPETVALTVVAGTGYLVGGTATAIGTILDNDATGTSLVNGLGGSAGFGDASLTRGDDTSSSLIDLTTIFGSTGLSFFGSNFTGIHVNHNGGVSFRGPIGSFTPTTITGVTINPFISAFWGDVDTRGGSVAATPGGTSTGSNLVWYDLDSATRTFTATWDDVGYFSQKTNRLNAFQIALTQVGNSGDFDLTFRYEALNWTTGDVSGGTDGLGGTVARAGYTSGDGVNFFELPQSGNQNAMLALTNASNVGVPGTFVYNVRSGAVQLVTLSVSPAEVAEDGSANLVYTFTRTGPTTAPLTVNYTVGGTATLGTDYTGISATGTTKSVTFAVGSSTAVVTVDPTADAAIEADETVSLTLADGLGYSIGTPNAVTGTIRNVDPPVITIAAADADKPEGTGAGPTVFTFTVTRQGGFAGSSSVAWAVAGSGPQPANAADFSGGVLPRGTVMFAAGETTKTITVNVAADTRYEADERFTVTLSSPSGATLGVPAQASGTIRNDDNRLRISITAADAVKSEGDVGRAPFSFTLTRTGDLSGEVSVPWSVVGSGTNRADRFDFIGGVLPSGTIRLAAGRQTQTLIVNVLCDRVAEFDEQFTVALGALDIVEPGLGSATATIRNDDPGTPRTAAAMPVQAQAVQGRIVAAVVPNGALATAQSIAAQAFATLADTSGSSGTTAAKRIVSVGLGVRSGHSG